MTITKFKKMNYKFLFTALFAGSCLVANAQQAKPEDTEIWDPIPKVVTPGKNCGDAPSDAIILFDGKNLDEWVQIMMALRLNGT